MKDLQQQQQNIHVLKLQGFVKLSMYLHRQTLTIVSKFQIQ